MITSYVNWLLIQRQTSHWVSIEIEINMQTSTDLSEVVQYLRELWRVFSRRGHCAHILDFLFPPCSFRKEEQDMALPLAYNLLSRKLVTGQGKWCLENFWQYEIYSLKKQNKDYKNLGLLLCFCRNMKHLMKIWQGPVSLKGKTLE